MENLRVLLVDDEEIVRSALGAIFQHRGDDFTLASNAEEALEILADQSFDLMVTDLVMPGMEGVELVREARKIHSDMVCLILTGMGTRKDVIAAIKEGVFDYIEKPVMDLDAFSLAIDRAGEQAKLIQERDQLLESLKQKNARLETSLRQLNEAYDRLRLQEEALEADLCQAQKMQQSLLPQQLPALADFRFFGYFAPCERLGGDFFDMVSLPNDRRALYLADVAGHGVRAAMVTVIVRELISAERMIDPENSMFEHPKHALSFLNRGLLKEDFDPPLLVTMGYVIIDSRNHEVTCGCAGHPAPILVRADGEYRKLQASGPVLGIEAPSMFETETVRLDPGDFILLYSDGLPEAKAPNGAELGEERLCEVLLEMKGAQPDRIVSRLKKELDKHLAARAAEDDITLTVLGRVTVDAPPLGDDENTIDIHAQEYLRTRPPVVRGLIETGWIDHACVIAVVGHGTWQQAHSFVRIAQRSIEKGVDRIHVNLKDCASLDSTFLGVLNQYAPEIEIHQPGERIRSVFHEMGIEEKLKISREPVPQTELVAWSASEDTRRRDKENLILSAHESLMEASEQNRRRFGPAVELMKRKRERTDDSQ